MSARWDRGAARGLRFALWILVTVLCTVTWAPALPAAFADPPPPPPPPPNWGDDVRPTRPPRTTTPNPGRRVNIPPPPPAPESTPGTTPRRSPSTAPRTTPGTAARPDDGAPRDEDAAPIITEIRFEGTVVYSPTSIKVLLRNKEGQPLDPVALDEDIITLFQYFREVEIFEEEVPGGVVLRIRVSENPLVIQLNIRGAAEMEESEIRALMRTRAGFPLNMYHLAEDAEDIVAAYRIRGFHFAHVPEPQISSLENGGRAVDLSIVEGPQVTVSRIVIRGNNSVPAKDIKEVMLTKEPDFFQTLFGGATFRDEALMEDIVAIKQLYRDEGFLDVEVVLDDRRFSDDKSEVVISIAIVEHQPYLLGDIEIDIERVEDDPAISPTAADLEYFTLERVRSWIELERGDRFSGTVLREGLDKLREEYSKRSFLEMELGVPLQQGRQDELIVDLKFTITEGPKLRVARIDFVGNEFTRDKILRREVRLSPGGYVDRGELERGEARIRRTGWFDRVSMRMEDATSPDGEAMEGYKNVTYELVEGRTGSFNFGVGLSTDGGLFGSITYTKRNFDIARWPSSIAGLGSRRAFTGAGQEFRVFLQPSTIESAFSINFREPRFFGTELAFDTAVFRTLAFREGWDETRSGYGVGFGYPLYRANDDSRGVNAGLRWRHDWTEIDDLSSTTIPGAYLFEGTNEIRSIAGDLRYRALDDLRDPVWEFSATARAEIAGTFLGGDLDFYKLAGSADYTRVVHEDEEGKKHRINARARVQFGEALDDTPELPPFERFYAGGTSFRGFRFRGMGPHLNGDPTGGEWLVAGTLEYEYPLILNTLGVVVFSDFGTLATTLWDDAGLWRMTAGLGLRIVIPAFGDRPLAFDFAFPVRTEDVDEEQVISFSLGRDF